MQLEGVCWNALNRQKSANVSSLHASESFREGTLRAQMQYFETIVMQCFKTSLHHRLFQTAAFPFKIISVTGKLVLLFRTVKMLPLNQEEMGRPERKRMTHLNDRDPTV